MVNPMIQNQLKARTSRFLSKGAIIPTPNFFIPLSKGTIPHLTPENAEHSSIPGVFFGLEECLDELANSAIAKGKSRLEDWIAISASVSTILSPRRFRPLKSVSASDSDISIVTSGGVKKLTSELYNSLVTKLQPDAVITLNDNPTSKPGVKRRPKMISRNLNWAKEFLHKQLEQERANAPDIIFPIPDLPNTYLIPMFDKLKELDFGHIKAFAFFGQPVAVPTEFDSIPRISLAPVETPHDILDALENGTDIFVTDLVTKCTDAGIALAFNFKNSESEVKLQIGINMFDISHETNMSPILDDCTCICCRRYSRAYIRHLLSAHELVAWELLQLHNIHVLNSFMSDIRASINKGSFSSNKERFLIQYVNTYPEQQALGPRRRGYQLDMTDSLPLSNRPPWKKLDDDSASANTKTGSIVVTSQTPLKLEADTTKAAADTFQTRSANEDQVVGELVDAFAAKVSTTNDKDSDSELEEELLEALDELDDTAYRSERMQQLKEEFELVQRCKLQNHMNLFTVENEKDVMEMTVKSECVVIHFFHPDFKRCKILDNHLEKLAKKYWETKFVRIEAASAPFLVTKFSLKVLPALLCFKDSVLVDKLIGFSDLGNTDNFDTAAIEFRFKKSGVIKRLKGNEYSYNNLSKIEHISSSDEDSDFFE
ncbi:queuine tRNA-ribosyltransferase [Schizosaccharomyces japonicus yFS275]|uniref:Queuine tRNA-ribosyltransferase n=1 Tax=Schizosaccharomyces japonicus (strain yFS275 / FY16936) TaxID=402676 RepID=T0TB37_SCHJY|nr:queuine tRNA-ribosyltransferase [Schizosaccharomyces japonicus yFS275]EQC53038.1 queuine tRNA-ribosyltransferase [Schizosaccharomyces japonicus yFS275]